MFFDFDGTLVPFARGQIGTVVERHATHAGPVGASPRVTLFVISGRRRADLIHHLRIPDICYLGLYGWERAPPFIFPCPRAPPWPRPGRGCNLERRGTRASGSKTSASACRFICGRWSRGCDRRFGATCACCAAAFGPEVRLIDNLQDAELVPRTVDGKGAAVRRLLAGPRLHGALPLYFGDDLSDEPAFAAVRNGIGVMVGSTGPTRAHYAIPERARLTAALRNFEAALP